jgi:hypothetical protein
LQERVEVRSTTSREGVGRRSQINFLPGENVHPLSRRANPLHLRQVWVEVEGFDVSKQAKLVK